MEGVAFDFGDIMLVVGFLVALGGQWIVQWRWTMNLFHQQTRDGEKRAAGVSSDSRSRDKELHDKVDANTERLHNRINVIKETYVRREDLDRDLTRIERHLENIEKKLDVALVPRLDQGKG